MRTSTAVIVASLAVTTTGCGAIDSDSTWKSGPYEVVWLDAPSDSHLSYRVDSSSLIEIVGSCVVAAGANEQFVVVEQRPKSGEDKASYFIISRPQYNPSKRPEEVTVGPLSEADFKAEASRKVLPSLEETMPSSLCRSAA